MLKPTIKDIAKALNLSTSTVSRALRDSYEISSGTKQKILEYAQAVNYTPNPIALSLRENKSHSICVIVPQIANAFFSEVINGIDETAYRRGYHVVIFQTHEQYEREIRDLNSGLARRADGVVISLSGTTTDFDHFRQLQAEQVPIVFFDRVPPFDNCHKVVADNFAGAYEGTRYCCPRAKNGLLTLPALLFCLSPENGWKGIKPASRTSGRLWKRGLSGFALLIRQKPCKPSSPTATRWHRSTPAS